MRERRHDVRLAPRTRGEEQQTKRRGLQRHASELSDHDEPVISGPRRIVEPVFRLAHRVDGEALGMTHAAEARLRVHVPLERTENFLVGRCERFGACDETVELQATNPTGACTVHDTAKSNSHAAG